MRQRHIYSENEKRFLRDNVETVKDFLQIANDFNRTFRLNIDAQTLRNYCKYHLKIQMDDRVKHTYSEEEKQFLRDNIKKVKTFSELTELFNKKFNYKYEEALECNKIRNFCNQSLHIRIGQVHHKYSEEEKQFLRDNIRQTNSFSELTELFNRNFGTSLDYEVIRDFCIKRLNLHMGNNLGTFAVRKDRPNTKKLGEVIVKDGYLWVKIQSKYHKGRTKNREYRENWVPLHRYVYEQHYGEIPEGNIIVFLDGNKQNCDIENLYSLSRSLHAVMCSNGWYSADAEATKTAIKWCELNGAIKQNYKELIES